MKGYRYKLLIGLGIFHYVNSKNEFKLSDIPKILQDSLGIDDDNKHR